MAFLGISLAGFDVLVSLLLAGIAISGLTASMAAEAGPAPMRSRD